MLGLINDNLTDQQTAAQSIGSWWGSAYFLSAIWMSGYGPAADPEGSVYLATGNSNGSNINNYPDSAMKFAYDLSTVLDYFTPSNFVQLDSGDFDIGSGGMMVLPLQSSGLYFAVAAGKDGRMFLFDRNHLGGYVAGGPDAPPNVNIGGCWCGPSYFVGSDGKARVVSSGGNQVRTWFLPTNTSSPLIAEASSPSLPTSPQDPGFHTFVSSYNRKPSTAIVWAVSRPVNNVVYLYAFRGDGGLTQLFSASAGVWQSSGADANIFPVAAGGKVYVASYKALQVFGELNGAAPIAEATPPLPVRAAAPKGGARVFGVAASVSPATQTVTLTLRDGSSLTVNLAPAIAAHASVAPHSGEALEVEGSFAANGVLYAQSATRAKGATSWGLDVK